MMASAIAQAPENQVRLAKMLTVVRPYLSEMQLIILHQLLDGPKTTGELITHLSKRVCKSSKKQYESSKSSVGKAVCDARAQLERFFNSPVGLKHSWQLKIPRATRDRFYSLTLEHRTTKQDASAFWAAHFGNGKPTRILIGRPTFLRSADTGLLIRNEAFDGDTGFLQGLLKKHYPELVEGNVDEIKPFVSLSDVQAMFAVCSYFDSRRRDYGHPHPEIILDDDSSEAANLVILGTPFDNPEIRKLEDEALEAFMEWNWAGLGSLYLKRDWSGLSKRMPNGDFRVWVHRRSSESRCETLVNASTSELLGPICELLTSDERVGALIQDLCSGKPWNGFPAHFRIQFRVRTTSDGSQIKKIWVQQYREGEDSFSEPVGGEQGLLVAGHAR
jgi:hypothetical protein